MDRPSDREVMVFNSNVAPGYLYDDITLKIIPGKHVGNIKTTYCPISLRIDIWNKKFMYTLLNTSSVERTWKKDLLHENAVDAIMVKGVKSLEKKGVQTPLDDMKHTVTSVFYKYQADLLVLFSQKTTEESLEELKKYLLSVLNESNESYIPQTFSKNFRCAYVYPKSNEDGKRISTAKDALNELCRILNSSDLSTQPVCAFIKAPAYGPGAKSEGTATLESSGKIFAVTSSSNQEQSDKINNNMSAPKTNKDEIPPVHSEIKPKQELNQNENGKGHRTRQFQGKGESEARLGRERERGRSYGCEIVREGDNVKNPQVYILSECDELDQNDSQEMNCHEASNSNQVNNHEKCEEANVHQNPQNKNNGKASTISSEERSSETFFEKGSKRAVESVDRNILGEDVEREPKSNVQNTSKMDRKMEPRNVFQKSQNDKHKHAKKTQQEQSGSVTGALKTQKKSNQGLSVDDEANEPTILMATKPDAHNATKKLKLENETQSNMKYKLINPVKTVNDPCGLERKYYGVINDTIQEKVIILLGASGCGKTTLVNFIANYFNEKKAADDELIHVETTSQTSAITAYTFCSGIDEIPITVIDTPGLNDSSGAEIRDHIQSLKTFLANEASHNLEIHAIGFVAPAHLVRLTTSERLVMDYVSKIFGQSVSKHLITFVTFADNQETPPVIEAMKNYGVDFKMFLKFNNSALSNSKSDEVDDLDRVYWRICWRNWKKCLKTLRELPALSVHTMKAVQSEIYAATVIKSAEKDLQAELKTFFTYCKKETCLTKETLELCEQIWELVAVVHRVKYAQDSAMCSLEKILVDYANEACKTLCISPEEYINLLSLAPSRSIIVSGSEIIRTMAQVYEAAKTATKNKEYKLKRSQTTGSINSDVLNVICKECKCPGNKHGVSTVESLFHPNDILKYTQSCLCKALTRHSLLEFAMEEKRFLHHLNQHLNGEHKDFIQDLLMMPRK